MIRPLRRTLSLACPVVALLALSAVPSLRAQSAVRDGSIDPGMTRAQVEERLGPPKVVRTAGAVTYLFYANGCARSCGMDDLVVLEQDTVTDAVFRSTAHRYSGQSSSPVAVDPRGARAGRARPARTRRAAAVSTGQATTAGPMDAPASVTNAGAPLHPNATTVTTPSRPAADSAAGRAPQQGAQLTPADSDFRELRRAVTIPGQDTSPARPAAPRPDSTRP